MAVIGELACGHRVKYPTAWVHLSRATEPCPICETRQDVREEWRETWRWCCLDCSWRRSHGWDERRARAGAAEHERRTGHRTHVGFYADRTADKVTVSLPKSSDDDEPPF